MNRNIETLIKLHGSRLKGNKLIEMAVRRQTGKSIDELIAQINNQGNSPLNR